MRWGRSSLFLLLNRNTVYDSPHPTFSVSFNLPKSMVLREVMPNATLPPIRIALQYEEWIPPLYGTVYLW